MTASARSRAARGIRALLAGAAALAVASCNLILGNEPAEVDPCDAFADPDYRAARGIPEADGVLLDAVDLVQQRAASMLATATNACIEIAGSQTGLEGFTGVDLLDQACAKAIQRIKLDVGGAPVLVKGHADSLWDFEDSRACNAKCAPDASCADAASACEGNGEAGTCEAACTGHCFPDETAQTVACNGKCGGVCAGTCGPAPADGLCLHDDCVGTCDGPCEIEVPGTCEGTCEGCSVEPADARCGAGISKPIDCVIDEQCVRGCNATVMLQAGCAAFAIDVDDSVPSAETLEVEAVPLLCLAIRRDRLASALTALDAAIEERLAPQGDAGTFTVICLQAARAALKDAGSIHASTQAGADVAEALGVDLHLQ